MNNFHLATHMFLQLSLILIAIKIIGYLGQRFFGQPQVVCEMITGVLIGPSFFGYFWPDLFTSLVPKQSIPVIYCLAQIGLVLYMFLIGSEFKVEVVAKRLKTATAVASGGIMIPMLLSGFLAIYFFSGAPYFADNVPLFQRWIFIGSAISITAFPMLARILHEAKLSHSSMGCIALAAGSLDDVTAWCLLAIVIAIFSNNPVVAITAILGGIGYTLITLFIIKPILKKSYDRSTSKQSYFGIIMVLLMLASYVTDALGIYSVFGAFILGMAMPRGKLTQEVQEKIEPLALYLFLPMFFIYSGLNTKFNLIFEGTGLISLAAVLIIAIFGKFVACSVSAKLGGEDTRSALCIGALMNARGLMELILLNIGLDHGIITPNLYTIMVMMAVITTLMATPIFNWIRSWQTSALPLDAVMEGPNG